LTFTAAPVSASGNNIYVLHHNTPASTATHPAAQALTATSGTFSSGISATTGAFTDNVTLQDSDNIIFGTGSDAKIFHDGSNTKFQHTGSGQLYIGADNFNITNGATDTNHLVIDSNGHVTMPKQSCFQARPSGVISNINVGSSQTLNLATEVFDLNADYNTSNYNFVAPVTGKYLLTLNLRVQSLDINGAYFQALILTSNKEYQSIISTNRFSDDPSYWYVGVTVVADMDASDTAIPRVYISSDSAAQVDMDTDSYFSGCLLA